MRDKNYFNPETEVPMWYLLEVLLDESDSNI